VVAGARFDRELKCPCSPSDVGGLAEFHATTGRSLGQESATQSTGGPTQKPSHCRLERDLDDCPSLSHSSRTNAATGTEPRLPAVRQ